MSCARMDGATKRKIKILGISVKLLFKESISLLSTKE